MEIEKRLAWGLRATDYQERINMDRMRHERLAKTRAKLKEKGMAAAILSGENIRYATGVYGRAGYALVFAEDHDTVIFMPPEWAEQRRVHCPWIKPENMRPFPVVEPQGGAAALEDMSALAAKLIIQAVKEGKVDKEKIGVDALMPGVITGLEKAGMKLVPVQLAMLEARDIKTEDEINCLRMVGALLDTAWSKVIESIKPGISDCELAVVAVDWLMRMGAEVPWADMKSGPLAAPNSGMHTDRILQPGDLGFGVIEGNLYLGYTAHAQRTWVVGTKPTEKQKGWYKRCFEWIVAAQDAIKPGVTTADVAKVFPTCDVFGLTNEWEVGANAIAHGSGLGVHDIPHISRAWSIDHPLPIRKGEIIALHFWYGEKWVGGARIENVGVVTDNGWENFFTMPYDGILVPPYQLETAH